MSLTWDRTDNREENGKSIAQTDTVRGAVVGENIELDCHLVPFGIPVGNGPGPENIIGPRFNWVL